MTTIAVAGATGDLGGRIITELVARRATVRALVRTGTGADARAELEEHDGVEVVALDLTSVPALAAACDGVACVVSALQGLHDVLVDVQGAVLDGAVAAHVSRFIPSDYSLDFTRIPVGANRNFDVRRAFHARLDGSPIGATSIFNGAFAELLAGRMPMLDLAGKKVTYWESADQRMDFTTMDDTAAFTAAAALDPKAPRYLRIAGDQLTARSLATLAGELTDGPPFELIRAGSLEDLAGMIRDTRAKDPAGEQQTFPRWQGMQYLHDMFSGLAVPDRLDNARYPDLRWTTARDVIAEALGAAG